jgi:hypothetical protein
MATTVTRAIRGLENVPAGLDPELASFLEDTRKLVLQLRTTQLEQPVTLVSADGTTAPAPGPAGPPGPPGVVPPYEPDLTPPPTPGGVTVSAGLDFIFITTEAPIFSQGHGYHRTIVYGATYGGAGSPPTFGDAVVVHEFVGQVGSFASEPGVEWHIWLKWRSVDGVLSTSPHGGANGSVATTSKIGNVHLGPLIVEAANLASGAVTATKIAAQAIDQTKFANGIEPVAIVAALPNPAGYTGPKTVLLTTDGKLYRYDAGAWTKAVDGADLVASSVVAGAIAAGAIGTTQLAAQAVTTGKLLVTGAGASITPDPNTRDASAWQGTGVTFVADVTSPTGYALRAAANDTVITFPVPLVESKAYQARISIKQESGATTTYLTIVFYDATGAVLIANTPPSNGTGWPAAGTYHYFGLLQQQPPAGVYTEYRFSFGVGETAIIPPGAVAVSIGILANYTGGAGVQRIANVRLMEKTSYDLIVDGSILANHLAANSIAVGTAAIQNGAIINAMMGVASITNANIVSLAATKITAGTIAVGEYIQSSDFVTGVSGWRWGGNTGEVGSTSIRGLLTAGQIDTRGLDIKDLSGNVIFSSAVNLDFTRVVASSAWLNSNVSIGADGALSGAGGGQVTIAGLDNSVLRATNPITGSNVTTYIASAAIGDAQILNLAANKVVSGSFVGKTFTGGEFTGTTFTGGLFQTSASAGSKRVVINEGDNNEARFYGDRGDGTVEQLASIGINAFGGDSIVGIFGSTLAGSTRVGLLALARTAPALKAVSVSGEGVEADSTSGYAVIGTSQSWYGVAGITLSTSAALAGIAGISGAGSIGVAGYSNGSGPGVYGGAGVSGSSGYGAEFTGNATKAPLFLTPRGTSPPTSGLDGSLCFLTTPSGLRLCYGLGNLWYRVDDNTLWDNIP